VARTLIVVDPGPLTTVQDRGRPGLAHLGVPASGWLDEPAALLANRLVGNAEGAAVLETTVGGVAVRTDDPLTVAVTGAAAEVTVGGRPAPWGEPVTVPAHTVLRVGPAREGVRSYLAVSGGIRVSPVLGSRSRDTLSGLGPPPLLAGAILPVGRPRPPRPVDAPRTPRASGELRLGPGPREDWLENGVRGLVAARWTVAPDSNRVALRLAGPPIPRSPRGVGELPSEGLVLGAVQVPPDGQPVVFLADHPTTGGYPVVGVVAVQDLWQCAQLRPGDTVGFAMTGVAGSRAGRRG